MVELEETTKLTPVEVVTEEAKNETATNPHRSAATRAESLLTPSSDLQEALENTSSEDLGVEIPPLPTNELHDASPDDREKMEQKATSTTAAEDAASIGVPAQDSLTTETKTTSTAGTQNEVKERVKTGSSTKITIVDLPPEISDKIMQEIRRPNDLASLCLSSTKLKALAAPRLYKNIELIVTQGTMFSPRLLHCLIIPEQRNLVHCKQINIYGEFKRDLVEDYERGNSATEHMYGMCLLLRDVLRKIPRDQLQGFLWYPDASPHSMILEHLRKYQTKIEDLRLFMPLFKPDYRTLLNIGDCTSLTTLHVGNIQTASHLAQINKLLERNSSKIESLRLEIESSVTVEDRQNLLIPDILMLPDTKHKPPYVRLAYFPIAEIPQTLKSYLNLDHLRDLVLISCENDKELLQAMTTTIKKPKLVTFELVTLTPEEVPEFLSSFGGTLKHLHLFFKAMDAGFSSDLMDSIVSHKSTLETLVLDGRFQTSNTAVAPSQEHLRSLRKLERLRDLAFSPEHYSSDAEIRAMHALLPPSLRALNCRISFNNELDRPHWTSGYALNFVTACLKSYSRPVNTDDWGASFGVSDVEDENTVAKTRGFDPRQLEILALGDDSDTKQMIYAVEIVRDKHGVRRPLVVEITRDEVDYTCDQVPRFLYFRHY